MTFIRIVPSTLLTIIFETLGRRLLGERTERERERRRESGGAGGGVRVSVVTAFIIGLYVCLRNPPNSIYFCLGLSKIEDAPKDLSTPFSKMYVSSVFLVLKM